MRGRFHFYACGVVPIVISSPGIALNQELLCSTSPIQAVCGEPSVEHKNALLRSRGNAYDRVIQSLPIYGSGAVSGLDRVWYEAASQLPVNEKLENQNPSNVAIVVSEIRTALSLQIKELAEILGVERPTVYAWLRGDAKPQATNRTRMGEVMKVVAIWKRQSRLPIGASIRNDLDQAGRTLIDELCEPLLDLPLIERRIKQLHQKTTDNLPQDTSILDLANQHGFDMTKVRDNQDIVDVLSGKRSHEE
jgi:DNA-binding transcriptional regulator YiaG